MVMPARRGEGTYTRPDGSGSSPRTLESRDHESMIIHHNELTVAEYCEALDNASIKVNRDYQRSSEVWPAAAQSFLIESILLGFPIPKLAHYQKTDRVSRKTTREIIDGQQRTEAIKAFYDGKLRLSRTLETEAVAGRTYRELSPDLQDKFLTYAVSIDLFIDATERDVREVFRRINSYEVPLNPEEQRHARYQGEFKWFIYHLCRRHDQLVKDLGAFGDKQLVRMQDMKLLTEVCHALINGVTTTSKRDLDKLYESRDGEFPEVAEFEQWIESALLTVQDYVSIYDSGVTKPYSLYALLLAVIHAENDIPMLASLGTGGLGLKDVTDADRALSRLAEALEEKLTTGRLARFVAASTTRTNVKDQREVRFRAYLAAVSAE